MRFLSRLIDGIVKIISILCAKAYKHRFKSVGSNFYFDPFGYYSFNNIIAGDNVNLGHRPILIATRSMIVIGDDVMFGPEVTVRGGNHRIDLIGRKMNSVKNHEKRENDDPGVIIESDVWIGTRAIILGGVVVGKGSVVGAGSVVTKSIPPYSIYAGNPAQFVRMRWSQEEIELHEKKLIEEIEGK